MRKTVIALVLAAFMTGYAQRSHSADFQQLVSGKKIGASSCSESSADNRQQIYARELPGALPAQSPHDWQPR